MIALDEAIDRQVWVKDYRSTRFSGHDELGESDED